MTHLTDDELGTLLREAFADHEHLAAHDRALALATDASARPHRGRALLAAAAAVALVAVGTSYIVSRGPEAGRPSADTTRSPSASGQPPLPPLQTDAANRAAATADAERARAAVPVHPGARASDRAGVPELNDRWLSQVEPAGHTVVRSAWWVVPGAASPKAVAQWYADHAPPGFHADGSVGGQGDGTQWVNEVYYVRPGNQHDLLPPLGTSVELQTTTTSGGVGVRATVTSVWAPARPLASFVQNVSSIDVQSTHQHVGSHPRTTRRSYYISAPASVLAAAVAFNDLPGMTPVIHSCPLQIDSYTDRITFHTATGDVVAVERSSSCGFGVSVARDGRRVPPYLGDPAGLLTALGVEH